MLTRNKNEEKHKNKPVFRYTSNENIIDIITSITSDSLTGILFYLMLYNLIQREGNVLFETLHCTSPSLTRRTETS